MDFEKAMAQLTLSSNSSKSVMAVAAAEDDVVLRAVVEAHARGLVTPVLCGNECAIRRIADECGLDIASFAIHHAETHVEAARDAVLLVRNGRADVLMKGILHTADFLRAVLDKEIGIRGKGILSHVSILHSPVLDRILLMTDAAMVTAPDLKAKVELVRNAVSVAHGLGIKNPKVAPLCAVEVVNPDMQATIDAAALAMMNQRGQIQGCVVDGPLALDIAVSEEAARHKGVRSEVAGKADIFLFHTIEAANSTMKGFVFGGQCLFGGLIVGATAPVVTASRSDSDQAKLYSIACAAALTKHRERAAISAT